MAGQPSGYASFPIKSVENIRWWTVRRDGCDDFRVWSAPDSGNTEHPPSYYWAKSARKALSSDPIDVIQRLYSNQIGELGCYWDASTSMPIEYRYAKIKLSDLFDYYTTSEGVLKTPAWSCLKYAVDEYMEECPRFKFHPSRVRQFIEENGIDSLELME